MNIDLNNMVAVVTGASSGIGLACAEMMAESGASVALIARQKESLDEAVKTVEKKGVARRYSLDVSDISSIPSTINKIREDLGEIDILVCSAGTNIPRVAQEVTEEDWDTVLAVNTKGLFFCNQAVAVQSMIPRGKGVIINISSQMGLVGGPERAVYCTSKGGVIQLTRALAIDWAPYNIRVNTVAPTFVNTPMTANTLNDPEKRAYVMDNILLGRLATANEVAATVCFLVSEHAAMITGATLPIDGGWTVK